MPFKTVGKSITIAIVLVSGLATSFFTAFSFWMDYKNEIRARHSTLAHIKQTNIPPLRDAMYNLDSEQIRNILRGVASVEDISLIKVFNTDGSLLMELKDEWESEASSWLPTLLYYLGQWNRTEIFEQVIQHHTMNLGKLEITLSENPMRLRLWKRAFYFFLSQGMKTSLVSFAILMIVQHFVTRHLAHISNKISSFAIEEDRSFPDILLERPTKKSIDEFDILVTKITAMGHEIINHSDKMDRVVQDLKNATKNLEDSNRKLASARAVAVRANQTKSLFLASLSHELRTPLTAIIGYSEIILDSTPRDKYDTIADLKHILESSNYLLNMINEILDYTKLESSHISLQPTLFTTQSMVEDTERIGSLLAKKLNNSFSIDNRLSSKMLDMDYGRIRQIITHFISNAAKFCHQGSIRVCFFETDRDLHISVEDTGIGFKEDEKEIIFKAFEQIDPNQALNGAGLGLAICFKLAKLMEGDIDATSQPGKGSKFTLKVKIVHPQDLDQVS